MSIKYLVWSVLAGVLFGLTGVNAYWALEPTATVYKPIVQVIQQHTGETSTIVIHPEAYRNLGEFQLSVNVINSSGFVVENMQVKNLRGGRKYAMLAGLNLTPGVFEVVATVSYKLNPLRTISQEIQLAILKVKEAT